MAQPRSWEHGWGKVEALCPPPAAVPYLRAALVAKHSPPLGGLFDLDDEPEPVGESDAAIYRRLVTEHFQSMLDTGVLAPESQDVTEYLTWHNEQRGTSGYVDPDSTLCCACSVADSQAGRCHRAWAAPYLLKAGWKVMLDGKEFTKP